MGRASYSYHNPNSKEESGGCCSLSCLKFSLYIYNLFSMASGLAVLAVSLWIIIDRDQMLVPFSNKYTTLAWIVLCIGAFIVLTTVIGCCGISRESHVLMFIYAAFCGLMIIAELTGGVTAYVYRKEVHSELVLTLNTTIVQDYGVKNHTTSMVDSLQSGLRCCGADSFEDWSATTWRLEGYSGTNKVPDSCCKTVSRQCGHRDHPSNIYYTGCGDRLALLVAKHLLLLGTVVTVVAGVQICGLSLSLKLGSTIRNLDD